MDSSNNWNKLSFLNLRNESLAINLVISLRAESNKSAGNSCFLTEMVIGSRISDGMLTCSGAFWSTYLL